VASDPAPPAEAGAAPEPTAPESTQPLGAGTREEPRSRKGSTDQPAHDLSALWYTLVARRWTSLAVISPDDSPRAWRLVQKLDEIARVNQYRALKTVNILDLNLERAETITHAIGKVSSLGERKRYLIAIDSPLENPVAIRVLSACDAVLLVLEKDRSRIPDAQRTVEMVGRGRLIGAVLDSP